MINVTQTYLPPIEEYMEHIKTVYENNWVTNHGDLLSSLTYSLKDYLGVENLVLTTNGTIPLLLAIKVLDLKGEIITTPFSYVATTSVISWQNCDPVFVDIHPEYLTIDEEKIEASITAETTAILACHVYGNPCHVERIEEIAKKYNLKVIYDAAHCFGVRYKGQSIFNYGDISTCSFHATKIFHTGEGGAVMCRDGELKEKLFLMHNFGHLTPTSFNAPGINGKMTELQAAMGLAVLNHFEEIIERRREIVNCYNKLLSDTKLQFLKIRKGVEWNYHYYPIIFDSEEEMLRVQGKLNEAKIYPRRYFYPSLNTLNYVNYISCPISESISSRVMCLPLYDSLGLEDVRGIVKVIKREIIS